MKKRRTCVVLAALTVAIAGCGDDSAAPPGGDTPEVTADPSAGATTTTGPALAGEPIVVGLITVLNGDFPSVEIRDAAEVAVAYLNDEGGGFAGRPIELVVCGTASTPESSSACANELVDHEPALVVGGLDTSAAASVPIFVQAGVPYVTSFATVPEEFTCEVCFSFNGSTTDIGRAFVQDFQDRGIDRVAVIHSPIPAGQLAAEGFQALAESAGISVDLVPSPVESPDASVALTTASRAEPQAIVVLHGRPQCASVMTTSAQLGIEAAMYYAPSCVNPDTLAAGGAGAEGARFSSPLLSPDDESSADVALFRRLMAEGSPDTPIYFNPQSVFSTFLTLATALEGLEGAEVSATSVTEALRATAGVPVFMGADGATITCDGSASERFSAVCSTASNVLAYVDGALVAG